MCDFIDGQQCALTTETNCNKSLLFVKLTDSALNSIERFLRTKGNSSEKPTIQFMTNNGTITLPVSGQKITYGFTLSNVKADGSSFQCIQHAEQKSSKSLGPIRIKMQISANEDSYAKTKCKMAAVEQEQKSLCTKEIKPNGSHFNRKNKIKHPGNIYPCKIGPLSKVRNQTCFLKPQNKAGNNAALSKEPIRRRIIHILAAKPYNKPDVLLRLMKEGINDNDKKTFPDILDQVGLLKGNLYTLSSHLWNEVDDNWKFCTKEELDLIRRRKLQSLKSDEVLCSVSQSSVQRHVGSTPAFNEPQSKKQRISHYNKPKVPEQTVKAGSSERNNSNTLKQSRVENHQEVPLSNQVNGACETNGKYSRTGLSPTKPHVGDCASELNPSTHMQKYHKITSKEQRDQYAIDFNVQYVEYMKLHSKMKHISEKLSKLENILHKTVEGSEEYKKTRLEIHKIYKSTVQSNLYMKDWKTFNSLQSNLSHIKKLIMEYDCV